jgi:hypothetical protein
MNKYSFKSGARFAVDAQTAGEELERIRAESGKLETKEVVEAARPDEAPLHPAFEWDDGIAAERYREQQARQIIRAVQITVTTADGEKRAAPAMVHITTEPGRQGYYQSTTVAVTNIDEWQRAMSGLIAKESALRRAIEDLQVIASRSESPERLAAMSVALKALDAAGAAIRSVAH